MAYIGKNPTSVPLTSSDITDGIISLPKLTDGTDGNLISYDASGNPVAVATGTDGQVLTSTGAGSPPAFEALPGGGKVLQVVQTFKATSFSSTATSFTDVTDLSVSITPSSASSKILVFCTVPMSANADAIIQLLRGATVIGSGTSGTNTNGFAQTAPSGDAFPNSAVPMCINYLDSPSTTSATTYKIQVKLYSAGTVYVNLRYVNDFFAGSSTITAMEIGV